MRGSHFGGICPPCRAQTGEAEEVQEQLAFADVLVLQTKTESGLIAPAAARRT